MKEFDTFKKKNYELDCMSEIEDFIKDKVSWLQHDIDWERENRPEIEDNQCIIADTMKIEAYTKLYEKMEKWV